MLDYDGTLAGFEENRDLARPYLGVTEILDKLAASGECRVVVVSGRESRVVADLLGLQQNIEIWGCHGGQRLAPNGEFTFSSLDPRQERGLHQARELALDLGLSSGLEQKQGCLAVHWRGRRPSVEQEIRKKLEPVWQELAKKQGLRLNYFDGGLELRAEQFSKARAVQEIWTGQSKPCVCAYLGDDNTDEEAFEYLQAKCLTVLVRSAQRATRAELWLRPPQELLWFLQSWSEACLGPRRSDD